jgi:hypothetical protein
MVNSLLQFDNISSQLKAELKDEIQIYPTAAENEEDVERNRAHTHIPKTPRENNGEVEFCWEG